MIIIHIAVGEDFHIDQRSKLGGITDVKPQRIVRGLHDLDPQQLVAIQIEQGIIVLVVVTAARIDIDIDQQPRRKGRGFLGGTIVRCDFDDLRRFLLVGWLWL